MGQKHCFSPPSASRCSERFVPTSLLILCGDGIISGSFAERGGKNCFCWLPFTAENVCLAPHGNSSCIAFFVRTCKSQCDQRLHNDKCRQKNVHFLHCSKNCGVPPCPPPIKLRKWKIFEKKEKKIIYRSPMCRLMALYRKFFLRDFWKWLEAFKLSCQGDRQMQKKKNKRSREERRTRKIQKEDQTIHRDR